MIHHGIHISRGHEKRKPWLPVYGDAVVILPVRLGKDADAVSVRLKRPHDHRRPEGRVVYIGVPDYINKIKLADTPRFHILSG